MNATPLPSDEAFMRRALRLAMNGRGLVEPNPMVGCVIVKNGRVIGEGWHRAFGGPHAEPEALAACAESPEGATAYVTLEPCCHTNKKTPPCRSIWGDALTGYLNESLDREAAAKQVADNYLRFVKVYEDAEAAQPAGA